MEEKGERRGTFCGVADGAGPPFDGRSGGER